MLSEVLATIAPADSDWRDVPNRVTELLKRAAAQWDRVQQFELPPNHVLFWDPEQDNLVATSQPGCVTADVIAVKSASGIAEPLANVISGIQKPFGGPNPLTAAITGSMLLGTAGYGAGALLDQFMPEKRFSRRGWRQSLGVLGAGLGAVPGVWSGMHNPGGFNAVYPWHNPGPQKAASVRPEDRPMAGEHHWKIICRECGTTEQCRCSGPRTTRQGLCSHCYLSHTKQASEQDGYGGSTALGGLFMQTIPVDAFNNAVWNDVQQPHSRFGSKSQWGNNEQQLSTPPQAAAAISGALAGAKTLTGKEHVSPWDVATAATAYGLGGLVGGMAAGKLLGAMAGLNPESQQQLQQSGMWAGLISGAAKQLLGQS